MLHFDLMIIGIGNEKYFSLFTCHLGVNLAYSSNYSIFGQRKFIFSPLDAVLSQIRLSDYLEVGKMWMNYIK